MNIKDRTWESHRSLGRIDHPDLLKLAASMIGYAISIDDKNEVFVSANSRLDYSPMWHLYHHYVEIIK